MAFVGMDAIVKALAEATKSDQKADEAPVPVHLWDKMYALSRLTRNPGAKFAPGWRRTHTTYRSCLIRWWRRQVFRSWLGHWVVTRSVVSKFRRLSIPARESPAAARALHQEGGHGAWCWSVLKQTPGLALSFLTTPPEGGVCKGVRAEVNVDVAFVGMDAIVKALAEATKSDQKADEAPVPVHLWDKMYALSRLTRNPGAKFAPGWRRTHTTYRSCLIRWWRRQVFRSWLGHWVVTRSVVSKFRRLSIPARESPAAARALHQEGGHGAWCWSVLKQTHGLALSLPIQANGHVGIHPEKGVTRLTGCTVGARKGRLFTSNGTHS